MDTDMKDLGLAVTEVAQHEAWQRLQLRLHSVRTPAMLVLDSRDQEAPLPDEAKLITRRVDEWQT
jgi:hypothetical protein